MRYGFTTGSCAAAAAKAAAWMLLFDTWKKEISIETPKGITYHPEILDISRMADRVSCAVRKDAGDDPDVTGGTLIYAEVRLLDSIGDSDQKIYDDNLTESGLIIQDSADNPITLGQDSSDFAYKPEAKWVASPHNMNPADDSLHNPTILIDGGKGVGRVTKPGLDQPVGNAAINHVPREMITKEVTEVCQLADFSGTLQVTISVPEGEAIAGKTFNPRLGIVGGISIIGTSGIVEPMSNQALLDTIKVELNQRRALGFDYVAVTPGNYGRDYMQKAWNYDLDRSVKCSNFIGDTIDMAAELGFKKLLLTGHIGKLVKVSGGIMNTHSKEGDCRMELIAAAAIREGVPADKLQRILDCLVTEEALRILQEDEDTLHIRAEREHAAGIELPAASESIPDDLSPDISEPAPSSQAVSVMNRVMNRIMDRIMYHLRRRAQGRLEIECVMYSNDFGELARSKGAEEWLTLLAQEQAQQI